MRKNQTFTVIEITKNKDTKEIQKEINSIVNKLIYNLFKNIIN